MPASITYDKDIHEHFYWAKEGFFSGAASSRQAEKDHDKGDTIINIPRDKNISSSDNIKPEYNCNVVKDTPGKDNLIHDLTFVLIVGNAEYEHDGGGQVQDGALDRAGDDDAQRAGDQGEEHVQSNEQRRGVAIAGPGAGQVMEEGTGEPHGLQEAQGGTRHGGAVCHDWLVQGGGREAREGVTDDPQGRG
jgi:hypothetical protein